MVICENDFEIKDKKNMNLPGCHVDLPALTEKDIDDLKNFAVKHGFDYVAASFVRKPEDVEFIREIIGPDIKIISKIEN